MSQMPWCQVWRMLYGGRRSVLCSTSTLVLWSWETKIVFSRPRNVLTWKTTYSNFGAAIWSSYLRWSYALVIWPLEWSWSCSLWFLPCIAFRSILLNCIPFLSCWKPWRRNYQVVCVSNESIFMLLICSLISIWMWNICMEIDHFSTFFIFWFKLCLKRQWPRVMHSISNSEVTIP